MDTMDTMDIIRNYFSLNDEEILDMPETIKLEYKTLENIFYILVKTIILTCDREKKIDWTYIQPIEKYEELAKIKIEDAASLVTRAARARKMNKIQKDQWETGLFHHTGNTKYGKIARRPGINEKADVGNEIIKHEMISKIEEIKNALVLFVADIDERRIALQAADVLNFWCDKAIMQKTKLPAEDPAEDPADQKGESQAPLDDKKDSEEIN